MMSEGANVSVWIQWSLASGDHWCISTGSHVSASCGKVIGTQSGLIIIFFLSDVQRQERRTGWRHLICEQWLAQVVPGCSPGPHKLEGGLSSYEKWYSHCLGIQKEKVGRGLVGEGGRGKKRGNRGVNLCKIDTLLLQHPWVVSMAVGKEVLHGHNSLSWKHIVILLLQWV